MPNIKNIIIFLVIAVALVLGYVFLIKPNIGGSPDLSVTNPTATPTGSTGTTNTNSPTLANDFLTLLLSVNNIKLNDAILSTPEFASLHDSSITLVADGTEGRANPFSVIGTDKVAAAPTSTPPAPSSSMINSTPPPPPSTTTSATTNAGTPPTH